jgi:hypothetical protein
LRAFNLALTRTLKHIKEQLNGHPIVIWSGRGYHVIQPIDCAFKLDNVKEFATLTDSPNNKFLQFAGRYISGSRGGTGDHVALRSCMLSIPGSLNSKCKECGLDPTVKILQKWDGHRPDQGYRFLIGSFYADLVGRHRQQPVTRLSFSALDSRVGRSEIWWIEKLLVTAIDDYRKRARDLMLVPYLVIQKGMTDEDQLCGIVMKWLISAAN